MGENISFGKKVFRLNTNNGIAKSDFDNKLNERQKKLLDSVFSKKFDVNQDGVLDSNELKMFEDALKHSASGKDSVNMGKFEARNFMEKELGLSASDIENISRDDLFEILNIIQCDCDSIESAETKDGITTVKYNKNIPEDESGRRILSESYLMDGNTPKPKSKDYATENGWVEHELYDNDELVSLTRTKGTVTETLDFNNDNRVVQRDINKGSVSVTTKFIYDDEAGTVTEQTFENGAKEPSSTVIKNIEDTPDSDSGGDDSSDDDDDLKPDDTFDEKEPLPLIKETSGSENTGDESPRVKNDYNEEK